MSEPEAAPEPVQEPVELEPEPEEPWAEPRDATPPLETYNPTEEQPLEIPESAPEPEPHQPEELIPEPVELLTPSEPSEPTPVEHPIEENLEPAPPIKSSSRTFPARSHSPVVTRTASPVPKVFETDEILAAASNSVIEQLVSEIKGYRLVRLESFVLFSFILVLSFRKRSELLLRLKEPSIMR